MAIVAATAIVFGVARQFQSLVVASPLQVKVFRDHGPALTWLRHQGS